MNTAALTDAIKEKARALGFSSSGACAAAAPPGAARLDQWLAAGYAGEMGYIARRRQAYEHPRHVLDGVRSLLMLATEYRTVEAEPPAAGQGRVSRYAWNECDYHDLIHDRLNGLAEFVQQLAPGARVRGVVDTAPLLERDFARLAGLGWIGKHTLLLDRQRGSWFFLAALLTDVELAYDAPYETDHCGTCRACLDACPTDAFPQPYVLDASRCISYLTIELKNHMPARLRPGVGDWLFGCDVCQQVCPWNGHTQSQAEDAFRPRADLNPVDVIELFDLDDDAFRRRFRDTPLWRPRRRGLLRNAAIVLGNRPTPRAIGALAKGLNDPESLVRGACAWALGQHDQSAAQAALRTRQQVETDAEVCREIAHALQA